MHNHHADAPRGLSRAGTFGEFLWFDVTRSSDLNVLPLPSNDPNAPALSYGPTAMMKKMKEMVRFLDATLAATTMHCELSLQKGWGAIIDASFEWVPPPFHCHPFHVDDVTVYVSTGMRGQHFGGDETPLEYIQTEMFQAEVDIDRSLRSRLESGSTPGSSFQIPPSLSSRSDRSGIKGTHEVDLWLCARRLLQDGDHRIFSALAAEVKYIAAKDGPVVRREAHSDAHVQTLMYLTAQHELAGTALSMTIVNHRISRGFLLPSLPAILASRQLHRTSLAAPDELRPGFESPMTPLPEALPAPCSRPLYILEVSRDFLAASQHMTNAAGTASRLQLSSFGDLLDRPDLEMALAHDLRPLSQPDWQDSTPLLSAFKAVHSQTRLALQMLAQLPRGPDAPRPLNLPPLPKAWTEFCEELCGQAVTELSTAASQQLATRRRGVAETASASSRAPFSDRLHGSTPVSREASSRSDRRQAQAVERAARYIGRTQGIADTPMRPMPVSAPAAFPPSPPRPAANDQLPSDQPPSAQPPGDQPGLAPSPTSGPSRGSHTTATSFPSLEVPRGLDGPGRSPSIRSWRRLGDFRFQDSIHEQAEFDPFIDLQPQMEDVPSLILPWLDNSSLDVPLLEPATDDIHSDSVMSDVDGSDFGDWDESDLEYPRFVVADWVRQHLVLLVDTARECILCCTFMSSCI